MNYFFMGLAVGTVIGMAIMGALVWLYIYLKHKMDTYLPEED